MSTLDDLARRFDGDRPHLRSVAFHLLGSAADAEDAVQSAWLKASRADAQAVQNLTGLVHHHHRAGGGRPVAARQRRAGLAGAHHDGVEAPSHTMAVNAAMPKPPRTATASSSNAIDRSWSSLAATRRVRAS
ncbi:hypothetical protein C1Y40_01588 [Mycobacterium talmoniae]|uniref:RNA polymerase sigma-70 region 2 domain-containing protein n=1 Tax=Mycobacterium talmoniae TaxID=1858794 RepID=A0A2S8BND1_9MYCO|nr:hypothetical protein C1Y40_01588 [Mycobacterium talmoniae]